MNTMRFSTAALLGAMAAGCLGSLAGCESVGSTAGTTVGATPAAALAGSSSNRSDARVALLAGNGKADPKADPKKADPGKLGMTTGSGAITPEMLEALKQLSAEDYKTRQEAVQKLQIAMAKHFQQMVLVQDMMIRIQQNLAEQLKQMTLSGESVDAQARVASLMEFNDALSRWAIDVMAMPDKKRDEMLKWGLAQDNIPLIAKAYNRKDEVRAAAARELAKADPKAENDQISWMLGQLLNDNDREVSLSAMDAVWDRPPTEAIIDTLWNKAVAYAMQQYRPQPNRQRVVNVRGRMITIYDQNNYGNRMQDADVAVDVLVKFKSPLVSKKLNAMFEEMSAAVNNPNDYRWRVISPNYGEGGKAISRLIESYRPKEAVPFLAKVLGTTYSDGYDTTIGNNERVRYSTRIDAAALMIKLLNQDPDDFKLRKVPNYGDRWMLSGGMNEENELVRKLQAWWKEHQKDYATELEKGTTLPAVKTTDTQPGVTSGMTPEERKMAEEKAAKEAAVQAAKPAVIKRPARIRVAPAPAPASQP